MCSIFKYLSGRMIKNVESKVSKCDHMIVSVGIIRSAILVYSVISS
jgi:hypothetical protein